MLGPRARRTPNQSRRDRRRIVITVVVVAVVALILGEVIDDIVKSSPGTQRRAEATWVSAASAVVAQSNLEADELHAIRSRSTSPSFDRVTLELALSDLKGETKDTLATYAQLGLAAPSSEEGSLMDTVLRDRTRGVGLLASGINSAIAAPPDTASAVSFLSNAGRDLEAADAAYHELTRLVRRGSDDSSMPRSRWVATQANWSLPAVTSYASALSHAPRLAAAPAIGIVALSIEPAPLRIIGLPASTTTTVPTTTTSSTTTTTTTVPGLTTTSTTTSTTTTTTTTTVPAPTTTLQIPPSGAVSVIAAARKIRVVLVVKDTGNTWIHGAEVQALIVSSGSRSGRSRQSETSVKVPTLGPGSSTYLTLRGLHVPRPADYVLLVTAKLRSGAAVRRSVTIDFSG